jgi:hypothetical protein
VFIRLLDFRVESRKQKIHTTERELEADGRCSSSAAVTSVEKRCPAGSQDPWRNSARRIVPCPVGLFQNTDVIGNMIQV